MGIDEVYSDLQLIEKVFRSLIVTTNYEKLSESEVSWPNYQPGIFKNIYSKEFESVRKNRQYSFLLNNDKGCIQYYFLYQNAILKKVKMAYYPYPVQLRESKDEIESLLSDTEDELISEYYYDIWNIFNHHFELKINDENLQKLVEDALAAGNVESPENLLMGTFEFKYPVTNTSHIRVDYDSAVTSHHKCEIQVGAINNIRLPLSKLISPFVFFEFIIKNIATTEYLAIKSSSRYSAIFNNSRKQAIDIHPFLEENIFLSHL